MTEYRACTCPQCAVNRCDICSGPITTPYYEGGAYNICALCEAEAGVEIPIPQHVAVFLLRFGLLKDGAEIACRDYSPNDGDYVGLENNEWRHMAMDGQDHFVIRLNKEFKEQ